MSTIDYVLGEIVKNCKNPRRKKVAIEFLEKKLDSLKYEDKLRMHLWEIIAVLKKIDSSNSTNSDDDD